MYDMYETIRTRRPAAYRKVFVRAAGKNPDMTSRIKFEYRYRSAPSGFYR